MSTNPRIDAASPDTVAEFATVMARIPDATAKFFDLYGEFWQRGVVPPELKEMTRLRNARITDCGY